MTFDLDAAADARRALASGAARDMAAPAAAVLDRDLTVSAAVTGALRSALPPNPGETPLEWVVGVEALARESVTLALAAAAEALGRPSLTATPQWPGCRGLDLDGAVAAFGSRTDWAAAVTAVLVGAAGAAVAMAVEVMKAAVGRDGPTVPVPEIADAAASTDGARLLLWDACGQRQGSDAAAVAASLARVQALDALRLALDATVRLVPAETLRPGAPLERLRRDASTVAQVAGAEDATRAAVAAGTLPG